MASNIKMFYEKSVICKLDENKRETENTFTHRMIFIRAMNNFFLVFIQATISPTTIQKYIYSKYKHDEDKVKKKLLRDKVFLTNLFLLPF